MSTRPKGSDLPRTHLYVDRTWERKKAAVVATFHSLPKFFAYRFPLTQMLTDALSWCNRCIP
jgi:hypothetical protein